MESYTTDPVSVRDFARELFAILKDIEHAILEVATSVDESAAKTERPFD